MAAPTTAPEPGRAATVWQAFHAPLRAFLGKRAPREMDVEDLLQDVFVRIQAELPRLRDADRIDAWIFQIARNVVADAFRERKRREALAVQAVADELEKLADDEERSAEAALVSCLASMIEKLPEPYRQAIELTEIRGATQSEAAGLVGISISGMKSRVQRGRERLAGIIRESCRIETDVRGHVTECDPRERWGCGEGLRPLPGSSDSMDMTNANESRTTESETTTREGTASGCCGGSAPKGADACCALDAEVKATGGSGCGCGSKAKPATKQGCC